MTSEIGKKFFEELDKRMPKTAVSPVEFEDQDQMVLHAKACLSAEHKVFPHDDPANMTAGYICKTCKKYWHFSLLEKGIER